MHRLRTWHHYGYYSIHCRVTHPAPQHTGFAPFLRGLAISSDLWHYSYLCYHNHMHKVALKKPPLALKFANLFGAFGYMSLFLEWLWVFTLIFYPLAKHLNFMLPSKAPIQHAAPAPLFTANATLSLVIGGIVAVACLALVIYGLYSVPRDLAKASSRATHQVARAVLPAITHHKPLSKKQTRRLTYATMNWLKLAAILLPLLAYTVAPGFPVLSKPVVGVIACFFASWAVVWFGIQLTIAKVTHCDTSAVW